MEYILFSYFTEWIKLKFIDINIKTLNLDEDLLKKAIDKKYYSNSVNKFTW